MTPREPLPPRKAIPKAWKAEAWTRDSGKCCECGADVPQSGPGVEYDHRLPLWLHGAHSVANIAPICPDPCHKAKTKREAPVRAKVNRIIKRQVGEKRPTRKIPGRKFNSKGKAPLGRLKRAALSGEPRTTRLLKSTPTRTKGEA